MPVPRVGLITIGQSPRDDIVPDMLAQLGFPVEAVERGALDGLSLAAVTELAPRGDEPWLVSRLRAGTEVRLAKRELVPRLQRCVDELAALGVDLVVPLCASDWSSLRCGVPFINPGRALPAIVQAMTRPGGTLGVISPTEAQARLAEARYAEAGVPIVSTHAQPYTDEAKRLRQCAAAGRLLAEADVALIYLSCMGHSREMRGVVREVSRRPTITANGLIAGLMAQALA